MWGRGAPRAPLAQREGPGGRCPQPRAVFPALRDAVSSAFGSRRFPKSGHMRLTRAFRRRVGNCSVTAPGSARAARAITRGQGHPGHPGLVLLLPAGRAAGHGQETKAPLGANNHVSAPWGARGCFARSTTAGAAPAPFWGCRQPPGPGLFLLFLTRHGLSQKVTFPVPVAIGSALNLLTSYQRLLQLSGEQRG